MTMAVALQSRDSGVEPRPCICTSVSKGQSKELRAEG